MLNHARCIVLEDMPKKGFELDEDMFVLLIDSYGKAGIVQESVKMFSKMKELGVERSVKSYDALFKVIVRKGRYMMAKRFFNKMIDEGIGPTRHTYNVLIWGFFFVNEVANCSQGIFAVDRINDGLRLLEEMKSVGIKPNNVTYTTLLPDLCDAGKMTEAKDILKEMVRRRIAPKDNSIFLKLLNSQCKAGDFESGCGSMDRLEKQKFLFRQLLKKGVEDPLAFNNLICGHAKEGTPDSAFEILKIMGRKGIPRDADAYRLLIESYLRKGEPADAKTALDSMIEDGHLPDSSVFRGVKENMDLVAKILEALLMRGHEEEALGRIDLLMSSQCNVNFDSLLSILSEKGKTIAALKLLDFGLQRDCDIDFKSYDKVLDALLAAGKTLNAYSILCKIMEKGGVTSWRSYEDLIKSLNQEGNTKQADILSRMIKGDDKSHENKKGKKKASVAA
ncbi:hypothetical protein D5086_019552 [Populus alba]|uniref:Uncharacterized protein n=1 Tax=Populus alba TaxID=43335 RepID=A0ACC4BHJ5_POPAL